MLTLVTPPAATPVTLAEARAHCRADTADDTLLQVYLDAAVAHVDGAEGVLGRCLVTQTWDYTIDAFPSGVGAWPGIAVPLPTLQSITSVKYYDPDGVQQTVNPGDYIVAGQHVVAPLGWPDIDTTRPGAVTVRFVAGYGLAAAVPAAIKAAILLILGDLYANRETGITGTVHETNPTTARLLAPYKKARF